MTEEFPAETVPPQDIPAEQAVIGSLMLSEEAIADVLDVLRPTDFYRPAHADIYQAVVDMYAAGSPVDPVTLSQELARRGSLARVGGAAYLHELVALVPSPASALYYARIVSDWAQLRRLGVAATRISQLVHAGVGDVEFIVDRAQAEVFAATESRLSSDAITLGAALTPALEELETIERHDGSLTGVPTGIVDLDRHTNGLQAGQLVVIGARPAVGKSTLGVNWAVHAALRHGIPAVVFSLEMSRNEIVQRVISSYATVDLQKMRTGRLGEDGWQRIAKAQSALDAAPLFLDDTPNLTVAEIRAKSRRLRQRHGIRLVVVDYIQLLSSSRRAENRQIEVAEFTRSLKLLAKELSGDASDGGVAVVAISQLNRGPESRADKTPMLSDLRESGGVENDADVVVLIHRDEVYDRNTPRQGEADLILAKCRSGPTGVVTVAFQGHYSRFVDMAPFSAPPVGSPPASTSPATGGASPF